MSNILLLALVVYFILGSVGSIWLLLQLLRVKLEYDAVLADDEVVNDNT